MIKMSVSIQKKITPNLHQKIITNFLKMQLLCILPMTNLAKVVQKLTKNMNLLLTRKIYFLLSLTL